MTTKRLPVTRIQLGSVSPAVLVCGDPGRAAKMATYLEQVELLSDHREYHLYRGAYDGRDVSVCSHGVGAPSAAVAFEELIAAGARRLIRVGTCGSLQPTIDSGHLIVVTAAVQRSGYGRETVPEGYPAVASLALTQALLQSAAETNHPYHSGIVLTRDNFYAGVATPYTPDYQVMSQAKVLAVEMECAALFIVGALRDVETAAILAVDGNVLDTHESMATYNPHQDIVTAAIEVEIKIALRALQRLEIGD